MAEHGQFEAAAQYYLECLDLDANHENALRNLGQVYMALKKYGAAELVERRRLALNERDPDAGCALVECLKAAVRPEDARDELVRMGRSHPDDPKVYRELGMLYRTSLHNDVLARQYLMESLRLDPNQMDLTDMLRQPLTSPMPAIPRLPTLPNAPSLPRLPGIAGENVP
jgi:tetratricopeptide (TPR) repeat protein